MMLIYVPMAGTGDRYVRAGYTQPKPLIPVDGRPMIERVLEAFPADARYLFAVNRLHAETTDVLRVLERARPGSKTVVIDNHKDGPVQTVLACAEHLDVDDSVCLNYCDFGVRWDFRAFERWLAAGGWDGAMSAYRGFHPHSLGPTLYAYMRSDGDRVLEIREKHHFTADKFSEFASSGLYWFRSGKALLGAARALVARGERVNGEFYASMLMQVLLEEGKRVGVYELDRFFQWGTPEDLRDWEGWAGAMRRYEPFLADVRARRSPSVQVIPMAGRGKRFADRGFADPKPLIDVAGRPMIHRALETLPVPARRVLVAQRDHAEDPRLVATVRALPGETRVETLTAVTEGQAITARIGVDAARVEDHTPVLFAPCDTGAIYDPAAWARIEGAGDADLVVWSARGHLPALWRPQMYGWMHVEDTFVRSVAVKKQVDGVPAARQEVVLGTFWFKEAATFQREVAALVADDDRVNGEFYLDTIARRMVARGARVRAFTVDKYVPWGTPEELFTFQYWNDVHRGGRSLG